MTPPSLGGRTWLFSNQITQAINSTASGPHGTCQLYAIVVYITISQILSNIRRHFEGASMNPKWARRRSPARAASLCLRPSLHAYIRAASLCLLASSSLRHIRVHLCTDRLIVARLHTGCIFVSLGSLFAPIRMLISPLWLGPMDKPASRAIVPVVIVSKRSKRYPLRIRGPLGHFD